MDWKDTTSYSKGDRGHKLPSSFTYDNGLLKITVTKGHIYYPDKWIMHCFKLNLSEIDLHLTSDITAKVAQDKAFKMIRNHIKKISESITLTQN